MSAAVDVVDALRIPLRSPPAEPDWKDWFHYLFFDPVRDRTALVNVCLVGGPGDGQIQTTFLVQVGADAYGDATSREWPIDAVVAAPPRIAARDVELVVAERTSLRVAAPPAGLALDAVLAWSSPGMVVTEASPFGAGFIGWALVPQGSAEGTVMIGDEVWALDGARVYHDHNFGRFRWGDDIGWEWAVLVGRDDAQNEVSLVLDVRTDRSHRARGLPMLFVVLGGAVRKIFLGGTVTVEWTWSTGGRPPPCLPGTHAATRSGRPVGRPSRLVVLARDERDQLQMDVELVHAVELIAPDPSCPGSTSILELCGPATAVFSIGRSAGAVRGKAYAEFVQ